MSQAWRFLFILWSCVTLIQASAEAQMRDDIRKEIDKIIYYDTEINAKDIPGFMIGLIFEDSLFTYDYGYADLEQTNPLSNNTVFELGGLSKVFTALLVDLLVEDSILRYDQTVNSLLDSAYYNKSLATLTVLDLVTHQTGFPKLPYEFGVKEKDPGNPYAHYTKDDLLNFYLEYFEAPKTKRQYTYSNVNYALLEILIENATNQPYEKLLMERIFNPLEMQNSFVHQNHQIGKIPTTGFSISGNPIKAFDFQSFAASEGIKSSMADLMNFLYKNLYNENEAIQDNMQNIRNGLIDTKINKQAKAAKGWHVIKLRKYYNAILHSGSTNGHRSFIGFIPETKTGVVLLSNSENALDGLGFLILRMLNYNWKKQKG